MDADNVDADLKAFIANNIHSVAQLELLLLLVDDAPNSWSATKVGRSLYISPEMAATLLSELHARGLLARGDADDTFRYEAASQNVDRRVRQLADLYRSRRVSTISLIHSAPVDKLQRFADAFRLTPNRKKEG
jgi:hypothetical protein